MERRKIRTDNDGPAPLEQFAGPLTVTDPRAVNASEYTQQLDKSAEARMADGAR